MHKCYDRSLNLFYNLSLAALLIFFVQPARAQLSGTFAIGAGGDYATFTDAVAALNAQGVSGR